MEGREGSGRAADWPRYVLGIDPGREKCGLALVARDGSLVEKRVAEAEHLEAEVRSWCERYPVDLLILGDRTGARACHERLKKAGLVLPGRPVVLVDEHLTSQEARRQYLAEHPPRGLGRLIPRSLRTPPEPYDDYVALLLARRYLKKISQVRQENTSFVE
ncbi:MAG: resolvase [Bacillota bacterium]|nr:resolvase [Bacillota bacterium]